VELSAEVGSGGGERKREGEEREGTERAYRVLNKVRSQPVIWVILHS